MLWSVNLYAYSNIKQYFNDAFNKTSIPAGNYDMTGYSYYPVDMPSGMNIADGAVFTFCNDKIVNSEACRRRKVAALSYALRTFQKF